MFVPTSKTNSNLVRNILSGERQRARKRERENKAGLGKIEGAVAERKGGGERRVVLSVFAVSTIRLVWQKDRDRGTYIHVHIHETIGPCIQGCQLKSVFPNGSFLIIKPVELVLRSWCGSSSYPRFVLSPLFSSFSLTLSRLCLTILVSDHKCIFFPIVRFMVRKKQLNIGNFID